MTTTPSNKDFLKLLKEVNKKKEDERKVIKVLLQGICDNDAYIRVVWDFSNKFFYTPAVFYTTLGYTKEEIYEYTFKDLIHPLDYQRSMDVYSKNIKKGVSILKNFYNRYVKKDGDYIWVHWVTGYNQQDILLGSGQIVFIEEKDIPELVLKQINNYNKQNNVK